MRKIKIKHFFRKPDLMKKKLSSDLNSARQIDLEFDEKSPAPKNFFYFVGQRNIINNI